MTDLTVIPVDNESTDLLTAMGIDMDYFKDIVRHIDTQLMQGASVSSVMETGSVLCRNTNEFCLMAYCLGGFIEQRQPNILHNK
jgi:hypothetical protein